jgi:hypothetical protein
MISKNNDLGSNKMFKPLNVVFELMKMMISRGKLIVGKTEAKLGDF